MGYQEIAGQVKDHVTGLFEANASKTLVYHNLEHTKKVVQRSLEIASFYDADEESLFVLESAAWFHDVGYLFVGHKNHEIEGVKRMAGFFVLHDHPPLLAIKIMRVIMATKLGAKPVSLEEKILCDADTYHFGTPEFIKSDELVKKEAELTTGHVPPTWIPHTIAMLKEHRFYTSYCLEHLEPGKRLNIQRLESMLK